MSEGAIEHGADKAADTVKKTGKGIKGILSKKVGPLPLGLWIVGIGGGLVAAAWLRRSYGGSTAGDAMDGEAEFTGTGGAALSEPGYMGTGGDSSYELPEEEDEPAVYYTNVEWRQAAINYAATTLGTSAITAQRTIDRYLDGKRLTANQRQLMDKIIAGIGAPPMPTKSPPGGGGKKKDPPKDPPGGGGGGGGGRRPKTNSAWRGLGVVKMVKRGFKADVVSKALGRWLAGKHITPAQRAIKDQVIGLIGPPPNPPKRQGGGGDNRAAVSDGNREQPAARRDQGLDLTPTHRRRDAM